MRARLRLALIAAALLGVIAWAWVRARANLGSRPAPRVAFGARWLKGALHVHSKASRPGQPPAEELARWYAQHGYDFIVFTDDNQVTRVPPMEGMLCLPGMELTQDLEHCTPPPPDGLGCPLHVGALFVDPARVVKPEPAGSDARLEVYGRAVDAALKMGGLAQINHPNFQYGAADPKLLAQLAARGATLVEIADQADDSNNAGDAAHPSTEALWEQALDAGAHLYGTATDGARHDGGAGQGEPGDRGFVMVFARQTPEDIRTAIEHGQFYASTGLLLSRAGSPDAGAYQVERFGSRTVVSGPEGRAWTQPRFGP